MTAPSFDRPQRVLHDLRDELSEGLRTQQSPMVDQPEIARAIEWLKGCRRDDGYWGEKQDGTTALALLTLNSWANAGYEVDPTGAASAVRAATAFESEPTARWIANQADGYGRWLTPWYTGIAVQALCAAGYRGPELHRGIEQIKTFDPENPQMWHDRVHHAAQILGALGMTGTDPRARDAWAKCILRHATVDLAPYVCGQAVHALLLWTTTPPRDLSPLTDMLAAYLRRTALSKSAFMDYAPSLYALALVDEQHVPGHRELISEKAQELFSRMEHGSWYRDAELTAWALLSLYHVGSVTQVVVDKGSFNVAFDTAMKSLPASQRRERLEVALLTMVITLGLVGVVGVAILNPEDSVLVNSIALAGGVPLLIVGVLRLVKRIL